MIQSDELSELGGGGADGGVDNFQLAVEQIPGTNQFKLVKVSLDGNSGGGGAGRDGQENYEISY